MQTLTKPRFVIFGMRANPEPRNTILDIGSERSVTTADADRPELANAFEVQRRVAQVALEESKILVCERADVRRKSLI